MSLRNATLRLKDNKEYGRSPEKRKAFRGSFFVGRMFVKTIERSEKKRAVTTIMARKNVPVRKLLSMKWFLPHIHSMKNVAAQVCL